MNNPLPDWLAFWQRPFPSANTLLIKDEKSESSAPERFVKGMSLCEKERNDAQHTP